jgi:hypothetical protein
MRRLSQLLFAALVAGCRASAPGQVGSTVTAEPDLVDEAPAPDQARGGAAGTASDAGQDDDFDAEGAARLISRQLALSGAEPAGSVPELVIVAQPPGEPWFLGIVNRTSYDFSVIADMRLLSFEVSVPGKKKPVHCRLPDALSVDRAQAAMLTRLGPQRLLVDRFDPRLYCFSSEGQRELVPGALVTPYFGWQPKTRVKWVQGRREEILVDPQPEPFVAETPPLTRRTLRRAELFAAETEEDAAGAGGATNEDAPQRTKQLSGPRFALGSDYARWAHAGLEPRVARRAPLALDLVRGSDAHAERTATVALTLTNRSRKKLRVHFRRELVSFEVLGPSGIERCNAQPDIRAPDPAGFLAMTPGRSITITSRLVELCPRGTFEQPGLYLVQALFDSVNSGEAHGLDGFVGRVPSQSPATIRIRTGPPGATPESSMQLASMPEQ